MNSAEWKNDDDNRRLRAIQKRTTRVNYIYLAYSYIYMYVFYHTNSVNVLNVKLPEYVFVQRSIEMRKLYKVPSWYYNMIMKLASFSR